MNAGIKQWKDVVLVFYFMYFGIELNYKCKTIGKMPVET